MSMQFCDLSLKVETRIRSAKDSKDEPRAMAESLWRRISAVVKDLTSPLLAPLLEKIYRVRNFTDASQNNHLPWEYSSLQEDFKEQLGVADYEITFEQSMV